MAEAVTLHCAGRCIETAARREYTRRMGLYFEMPHDTADHAIEEQLETLREFLCTVDFQSLRASDRRLAGEEDARVTVSRTGPGVFDLRIE